MELTSSRAEGVDDRERVSRPSGEASAPVEAGPVFADAVRAVSIERCRKQAELEVRSGAVGQPKKATGCKKVLISENNRNKREVTTPVSRGGHGFDGFTTNPFQWAVQAQRMAREDSLSEQSNAKLVTQGGAELEEPVFGSGYVAGLATAGRSNRSSRSINPPSPESPSTTAFH
jgi:hypothetical protein